MMKNVSHMQTEIAWLMAAAGCQHALYMFLILHLPALILVLSVWRKNERKLKPKKRILIVIFQPFAPQCRVYSYVGFIDFY